MTNEQLATLTEEEKFLWGECNTVYNEPFDEDVRNALTSLAEARLKMHTLEFALDRANMELSYLRKATPDVRTTT